jgi:hypothetical protein
MLCLRYAGTIAQNMVAQQLGEGDCRAIAVNMLRR